MQGLGGTVYAAHDCAIDFIKLANREGVLGLNVYSQAGAKAVRPHGDAQGSARGGSVSNHIALDANEAGDMLVMGADV